MVTSGRKAHCSILGDQRRRRRCRTSSGFQQRRRHCRTPCWIHPPGRAAAEALMDVCDGYPCMVGSTRTAPTATASDDDAYADSTPARQRHPPRSSWRKTPKRFWSTSPAGAHRVVALVHHHRVTLRDKTLRVGLGRRGPLSWLWKDGPLHAGDRAGRRD